nr:aminotransferase class I/II-fold pyridoxal phosphate-dependent enzyme [Paracidobacterium acidisoli]
MLDFSASIHPVPPPQRVLAALSRWVADPHNLIVYPDSAYRDLISAIATYVGADATCIAVGNGMMPLLHATLAAFEAKSCLVLAPCFTEYHRALALSKTRSHSLLLSEEKDFTLEPESILSAIRNSGCDTLLFANPHSPSGVVWERDSVLQLAESAAVMGVTTIVDEAFIDYLPEESLALHAAASPHLVVLRSITKFFAMPGMRVAYALAHPALRDRIHACMPLWPIDSLAAEGARLMLSDSEYIDEARRSNATERTWLSDALCAHGLHVYPGRANYLLMRTTPGTGAAFWKRLITEHGIVLRACANFEGLNEDYFRIAVRCRAENERFIEACAQVPG